MTESISKIQDLLNSTNTDPSTQILQDLETLIADLKHGATQSQLQADYKTLVTDGQNSGSPAFTAAFNKMINNGNDLSNFMEQGCLGDPTAAIGQASALANLLAGTNSLTTVNEDLETLQQDLAHNASAAQLQQDYKKLLQDGYALKDEGAAPLPFLQAFDQMVTDGNDLSNFFENGAVGDANPAIGQTGALLNLLAGTNSLTTVNKDLETLQQDLAHNASTAQLQQDYKKLLQDGYALKGENAAPLPFLQAFDQMVNSGNDLSNFLENGATGDPTAAQASVQNFLNLL